MTCLAFKSRGEEAVNFYVSTFRNVFPDSRIASLVRSEFDGPIPKGALAQASFELAGLPFAAFDGGPPFAFAQGMSIMVNCDSQKEIDALYDGLSKGGQKQPCGWLTDKFGVSWQIIPANLGTWLGDAKGGNTRGAMEAMLKMQKLDIKTLEAAYRKR